MTRTCVARTEARGNHAYPRAPCCRWDGPRWEQPSAEDQASEADSVIVVPVSAWLTGPSTFNSHSTWANRHRLHPHHRRVLLLKVDVSVYSDGGAAPVRLK
ncbi:hypothetical protein SCMC78_12560 [Streptomyces sp. CMC78]|uniref:Uncharacterized protein n=1 Tax=Streptomyces sp. CMC78 TaxID=3231512 RepID=A0AB33KCK1_9ACTN